MEGPPELAVEYHGEGFPILFVHGWGISGAAEAADFEYVFAKTSGYRRVYIDLPGVGATPAGNIQNLDDVYEAARAFVTKHLHPSPFLLVGTSCGAYLARTLAYEFANSVQGLLLRVPLVVPENSKRQVDPFQPVIEDRDLLGSYKNLPYQEVPVQTTAYVETLQRKWGDAIVPALQAADEKTLDMIRTDTARYRLNKPMHSSEEPFAHPALILTGRQDNVVGYRDAWRLMGSYPRASFAALDRGDHLFPVDELQLFEALVVDWLRRVEETQAHVPEK